MQRIVSLHLVAMYLREILLKTLVAMSVFALGCQPVVPEKFSTVEGLFVSIPSEESGLSFTNALVEDVSGKANLLDFDYFYNGAGVGICDLDNDGLPEVLLTGNQVGNKLFRNRGDLTFEDVTEGAGINTGKHWSNGVTFADVNRDGLTDIYISQGGPHAREHRANLLLINQGDLRFNEEAKIYGLDDHGISTQSTFLDYDLDGDLDCFVMNESELYGYDPIRFYRTHLEQPGRHDVSFSHLYRNDDGHFTDVTEEAGVDAPTFGLGLAVSDFNSDGWPDIYVANDYFVPDYIYINRKDGRFSDRSKSLTRQMSFFGMGVDVADLDRDGHQDIFVADMASADHIRAKTLMASMDLESFDLLVDQLGMPHQYMFNTLHLNDQVGRFVNVAHQTGLAKTDWSWAPLAFDVELDGDFDLLVTNGYRRYALDNDFKAKVSEAKIKYGGAVPLQVKKQLYDEMPSETLPNLLYFNEGVLAFEERGLEAGLDKPTFSNGAAYADLDRDGDLDLVISNIDQEVLCYRNLTVDRGGGNYLALQLSPDLRDRHADVTIWVDGVAQVADFNRVRGYRSAMEPIAHFGIGDHAFVDSIIVKSAGKVVVLGQTQANQYLNLKSDQFVEGNSKSRSKGRLIQPLSVDAIDLRFEHRENEYNDFAKEVLLPHKQSTLGPILTKGDIDGDGLDDLFVGGAAGHPGAFYRQQSFVSF